jgi:hypothetical protein
LEVMPPIAKAERPRLQCSVVATFPNDYKKSSSKSPEASL